MRRDLGIGRASLQAGVKESALYASAAAVITAAAEALLARGERGAEVEVFINVEPDNDEL